MKRTIPFFLIAMLFVSLLLLNFAPPAGASKSGHGLSEAESAKRNRSREGRKGNTLDEYETLRLRYNRFQESREESHANSKPGALKRVGNFFKNLFVPSNNKTGNTPGAQQKPKETDPDMNSRFGVKIDRWDYLRQREEMVGMLRGLPLPEGVSPDVRSQAIRQMERQEEQVRTQVKNGRMRSEISGTTWTPVGPDPIPDGQTTDSRNPVSGRVTSIAIHPTNPNIVYVGTAQGGLYRTLDGGTTWTPLMDGALTLAIGSVAIDPNNPNTLFVGTGEGGFGGGQFFGVGVYRIKNADTTPVLEGPFNTATNTSTGKMANGRGIPKILVCPTDSNIIFVATSSGGNGMISSGSVGVGNTARGVYRSVNAQSASPTFQKLNVNGATGTGTDPGLNTAVQDMEFEPGNPNNLLVGVDDSIGGGTDGLWLSTNALDADNTAVAFTQTLAGACSFCNTQIGISKKLGVVTVYVALETSDGGEVHKSIDGGVTFDPDPLATSIGFCGGQCFYDMPVAVDPTEPNNVLIGGSGDYDDLQTPNKRSTDGTDFNKASDGLHPDSHAIEFAPSDPLIVYHGNDGGIFKSIDGGETWTSMNTTGLSATQFVDISTHPTDRQFMIGGTQDNGTPYLQPDGTWKLGDFGDGGYSLIDQNATDTTTLTAYHTYYNATNSQMLFVRANNGSEIDPGASGWPTYHGCIGTSSNNGIICSDAVLFYAPMAQGPGNPNTIYYGAAHLFRSANRGDTMPAVSQALAQRVSAIGISPQNDNVRLVGGQTGLLFGTSTGANPLVNLDPGNTVPNVFISRAVLDPNDNTAPYTAYVTLDSFGLAPGAHVWKTTNLGNAGTTWTLSGTGIPDVPTNTIVVDPQNSNHLFAGTDIGVYISQDAGATWNPYGAGLPRVAVFDIEFQARNDAGIRVLRIATHGRGIWEITPLGPTAAAASISGKVTTPDGAPLAGVTMNLSGARTGKVITDAGGNYHFENVDTDNFYTVTPALVNYHFGPESASFSLLGNKTDAMFTATHDSVPIGNAIDSADYFVRQHYLDFLGREPDEAGFNFWSDQILSCGGDAGCRERRTINVSAAYFQSIEFQHTGGLVDGLYRASYGRAPRFAEFMPDTATVARDVVVGSNGNWSQTLEANKQAFIAAWMQRSDFRAVYDGLANNAFVDALISRAGGFNGDRSALVNGLNNGSLTRATALRQVVENEGFVNAKRNEMFVMMEYFGYLRRDPDAGGYQFWLNKLNQFNGNFEQAEMVKAFINSDEYRNRFRQ